MKIPGNFGNMIQQAQVMQEKMQKVQGELEQIEVEGSAGGDMVRARMNGKKEILSVKIDPEIIKEGDVEMIEDMVLAALNDASRKAAEEYTERMKELTGGMNIPGLNGLM